MVGAHIIPCKDQDFPVQVSCCQAAVWAAVRKSNPCSPKCCSSTERVSAWRNQHLEHILPAWGGHPLAPLLLPWAQQKCEKVDLLLPACLGEELKQLPESLIRAKCKPVFFICPLFFLLSLSKVGDCELLALPQPRKHEAHRALYLQCSTDLRRIHSQRHYTVTYRHLCAGKLKLPSVGSFSAASGIK